MYIKKNLSLESMSCADSNGLLFFLIIQPRVYDILIYYFRLSVLLITYLFQARKVEITVIDIESP